MCNCISYNKPEKGQTKPEVVIRPPFLEKTICIDSCIEDELKKLWAAGFTTLNSCCGHNKENASIVVDRTIAVDVRLFINKNFSKPWKVLAWELVEY